MQLESPERRRGGPLFFFLAGQVLLSLSLMLRLPPLGELTVCPSLVALPQRDSRIMLRGGGGGGGGGESSFPV